MNSILSTLPPELLSRTISFLSEDRKDISACRLVCHTFKELGSPYLITRVVFAKRLETVSRLHDVLQHPYFSRHVTELVYDASQYDEDIAADWNEYVEQCQDAPRSFVDLDWAKRKRTENLLWHRFAAYSDLAPPRILSQMDRTMAEVTNDMPYIQIAGADVVASEVQNLLGEDVDALHGDVLDEGDVEYYEQVYRLGCHKGFPDYHLRFKAQTRMQDAKLPSNILQHILARLPKLRTIHFTDYRGLGRAGESYDRCCFRLFGNTLEPTHMSGDETCWEAIMTVLNAVAVSPQARIDELCLATNPYGHKLGACICEIEIAEPRVPAALPLTVLKDMGELGTRNLTNVFSNLRRLDLPFVLGEEDDLDLSELLVEGTEALTEVLQPLRSLLEAAAPNLTHLALSVTGLSAHSLSSTLIEDAHRPADGAHHIFQLLLSPTTFSRLQHLELSGWVFPTQDLQEFLGKHHASLRELRLLNNIFLSNSEDLARWGREDMSLSGVRIANWDDQVAVEPASRLRGSRTAGPAAKTRYRSAGRLPDGELEVIWLDGRINHASAIKKGFEDAGGPWWMQKLPA